MNSAKIHNSTFITIKELAIAEYQTDINSTQGKDHMNAKENLAHVSRLVKQVERNQEELKDIGLNIEALILGIYFSDIGKSNRASQSTIDLYKNEPTWKSNTRFKAFLRHEDYGINLVQQNSHRWGLSSEQTRAIIDCIANHNGPGILESWFGARYFQEFKTLYGPPKSLEGIVHTFLDRIDQGSLYRNQQSLVGGIRKIVFDEYNRSPEKKFAEIVFDIFYNTPSYSEQQIRVLEKIAESNTMWKRFFETHFFKTHFARLQEVFEIRKLIEFDSKDKDTVRVKGQSVKNPQELFWALELHAL